MKLLPGDVIRVWDRNTRPPKFKRHICICPDRQHFLRINSKPVFPPHLLIKADGADFLDEDSYVELQQLVRHFALEIDDADYLGRLNATQNALLQVAVEHCKALPIDIKEFIIERLLSVL